MLTNKSLCVVLELCQSYELWHWIICTPVVLALSYLLSLLCSLILSIHYTSRQHFTSSKSGIISCTWRCTWKGQDQNWNMREQTFDSTNAAPSPSSCATSLQAAATIRLSFLDRGWTMDMLIVKSMKMNTTLSPGTSREVFSSVRYTVYQHLEVLLERHGWINTICLVFLWRTVSEPGYWRILRLYPVQSFLISCCST